MLGKTSADIFNLAQKNVSVAIYKPFLFFLFFLVSSDVPIHMADSNEKAVIILSYNRKGRIPEPPKKPSFAGTPSMQLEG